MAVVERLRDQKVPKGNGLTTRTSEPMCLNKMDLDIESCVDHFRQKRDSDEWPPEQDEHPGSSSSTRIHLISTKPHSTRLL